MTRRETIFSSGNTLLILPSMPPLDGWHGSCIFEYNQAMLDIDRLRSRLPVWGMGRELELHRAIGSTNDRAAELARQGAPQGTLVVAEEQTAGRGRAGSRWSTPPGSALALSLVLRPQGLSPEAAARMSAVGALAVAEALEAQGAAPQIKWPNDVLIDGGKAAGVLAEGSWEGTKLEYMVLGIGINVRQASVPPAGQAAFPATCVEAVVGHSVDRQELLLLVVEGVGRWYPRIETPELLAAWEHRLAFMNQEIMVFDAQEGVEIRGIVQGLTEEGHLRLKREGGSQVEIGVEAIHLRPVGSGSR
jgi:BirA family biotin operon repressor/biotin-[acetyl-CoA-carboxylase] ligase